jgi:exonuclease VII small subunit
MLLGGRHLRISSQRSILSRLLAKLDASLTKYEEAENSGTFCKEHLENVLLQYSEDVSKEIVSSGTTT